MTPAMNDAPPWFVWAAKEIGTREDPENAGPAIRRYVQLGHCGQEGDPWCAIFANAALEQSGIPGTRSALARSFEHDQTYARLPGPAFGAIVTFWRGNPHSGLGHVGFCNGLTGVYISTLGGNESDMVQIELLRGRGSTFGLSGFFWPKSVKLPQTDSFAPVLPAGTVGLKVT